MKRLASVESVMEAYLLRDLLRQAGIEATIQNQYATGALGELPFTHAYPELWVEDEAEHARAQAVLRELHAQSTMARQRCPACGEEVPGNFLECWNCGQALPAAAR